MAARLGHVLGWAGNMLAVLLLIGAYCDYDSNSFEAKTIVGLAVLIFLIGQAFRYVLAGGKIKET